MGQEVTLDFTTNSWGLPTSNTKEAKNYTSGTYTISLTATTQYKFNSNGYLYLGKEGSTLTLPAFNFDVEKIEITGNDNGSVSVKQNIYVGDIAVSTETTGCADDKKKAITNTYLIDKNYQKANNIYTIKVTSKHNTQITKINIYKKSSSTEEAATTLSFPTTSVNANTNSTITIPTATLKAGDTELTGETIEYSYTTDKEGVVTKYNEETREMTLGNVEGTVTVKANYAGSTGKYKAADEVSYTIHVANAGKTATTITFPESSFIYQYGEEDGTATIKNIATLSPAEAGNLTYSISSSVEDFVILDDKDHSVLVDTKKVGTATITASFAENENYAASSASYTITVEDNRTTPTISFPKKEYSFELGTGEQTFTNKATIDPTDAGSLSYHSDKDWVAVDDNGYVILSTDEEGTATITATYAENDKYKAATASYTITVKKKVSEGEGVLDFSKSAPSKDTQMSEGEEVKIDNYVTLKVTKNGSSNAQWTANGIWKIYKNSEYELSAGNGYHITSVTIEPVKASYAKYSIQGGDLGVNWTGAAKIVSIVNDANSNSQIKSITVTYAIDEAVTPADQGFLTYAADYDVNYSELGFTTYAVKLNAEETKVTYNKFDGVVPAGKAVLLQGEVSKDFTLTPATESADNTFDTDLIASDGTVTTEGNLYYAFTDKVGNKPGFKIVANGVTIPAKRGYLKLKDASAAKFFSFDGGEGTTGIGSIEQNLIPANATIYNLAGQRVSKDYKGVIIVNGKKMVNK